MSVPHTSAGCVSEVKTTPQPTYGQTVSGYGGKIPTRYMVKYCNRWKRVYAMSYGNSASLYIITSGQDVFLDGTTESKLEELR